MNPFFLAPLSHHHHSHPYRRYISHRKKVCGVKYTGPYPSHRWLGKHGSFRVDTTHLNKSWATDLTRSHLIWERTQWRFTKGNKSKMGHFLWVSWVQLIVSSLSVLIPVISPRQTELSVYFFCSKKALSYGPLPEIHAQNRTDEGGPGKRLVRDYIDHIWFAIVLVNVVELNTHLLNTAFCNTRRTNKFTYTPESQMVNFGVAVHVTC